MKILLLNPHIDASHEIAQVFLKKGIALILSNDPEEAWQMLMLHGSNTDLIILHKEFLLLENKIKKDVSLEFIERIQKSTIFADIPIILTSEKWGDPEFVQHQQSPHGVNAYLKYPCKAEELLKIIEQVLHPDLGISPLEPPPLLKTMNDGKPDVEYVKNLVDKGQDTSFKPAADSGTVLEDAAPLFTRSEKLSEGSKMIHLEAPDVASQEFSALLESPQEEETASAVQRQPILTPEPSPLETFQAQPVQESQEPLSLENAEKLPLEFPKSEEPSNEAPQAPPPAESKEEDFVHELPYLYDSEKRTKLTIPSHISFQAPLGDAVVPGGAAQSPDVETLKKYLLLREQDVIALSTQLKSIKDQLASLDEMLKLEKAKNVELEHVVGEQKKKIEDFEKIKTTEKEILVNEVDDLKFQLKTKSDKIRLLESRVREAVDETERLKDRVRTDIRKIRVREKELENRLEIIKKDSEALLGTRENKIVELKRKLDVFEFNMDLMRDQYTKEKENLAKYKDRFSKASQAVRVAGRILEGTAGFSEVSDELASVEVADQEDKEAEKKAM